MTWSRPGALARGAGGAARGGRALTVAAACGALALHAAPSAAKAPRDLLHWAFAVDAGSSSGKGALVGLPRRTDIDAPHPLLSAGARIVGSELQRSFRQRTGLGAQVRPGGVIPREDVDRTLEALLQMTMTARAQVPDGLAAEQIVVRATAAARQADGRSATRSERAAGLTGAQLCAAIAERLGLDPNNVGIVSERDEAEVGRRAALLNPGLASLSNPYTCEIGGRSIQITGPKGELASYALGHQSLAGQGLDSRDARSPAARAAAIVSELGLAPLPPGSQLVINGGVARTVRQRVADAAERRRSAYSREIASSLRVIAARFARGVPFLFRDELETLCRAAAARAEAGPGKRVAVHKLALASALVEALDPRQLWLAMTFEPCHVLAAEHAARALEARLQR